MQCTGKLKSISLNYITKKPEITLEINENTNFEEIQNIEKLNIEMKKYRKKRSKDANSYAWKLIGEMADILRADKDEIYENMLFQYGQTRLYPELKGQEPNRIFKYYRFFQDGVLNGKECDWYKVAIGSSEYDTREMSIFIDGVISEAKEMGIQTDTPEQIAKYKEEWK